MKPLLFFLIIPLLYKNSCQAQVSKIDSILVALKTAIHDTDKVNDLNELAYAYRNIQPDTGLLYAQQALKLAEQLAWKQGIGRSYKCMGNNYYSLSEPERSLEYYEKALEIYQQISDKAGVAEALVNIGTVHQFFFSDYLKAMEYYERSLLMFQQMNDKRGIAKNFSNKSGLHDLIFSGRLFIWL